MRIACHPTWREFQLYVVSHPGAWMIAELSRRLGPVVRVPVLGTLISDPETAWTVLRDDRRFIKAGPGTTGELVTQVMGETALINMDGAPHRELRDRLRSLFAPAYVESLARDSFAEPLECLRARLSVGETVDLVSFMLS
jgi:cytochrome P450